MNTFGGIAQAFHKRVHTHFHAGCAHKSDAPVDGNDVINVSRCNEIKVIHSGGACGKAAVPAGYHAGYNVDPLHQHTAKKCISGINIRRTDNMHLLGTAEGNRPGNAFGFSVHKRRTPLGVLAFAAHPPGKRNTAWADP